MNTPSDPPASTKPGPEHPAATPDEILKQLHEGDFKLGFELAERLVTQQPESAMAWRLVAMGHLALGRTDDALGVLDHSLELHEKDPSTLDSEDLANVYATRAVVQLQQEDLWSAEDDAKAALALNPDELDALFVATVAATDENRLDEALGYATRLEALAPGSPDVHGWLARILSAQGKPQEAAKAAARARELGFLTSELEEIEKAAVDPDAPRA